MEGVLSEGMCRCCASEGSFKDFQVPYQWMGVEEIYSNMMKDCFDISLMVTEDGNNGGICEVCITQLRNAFNFKLQVQQTELKFKRKLEERSFKDSIKMELSRDGDDDSNMSGDFSSNDYEVPIKVEKVEDKPKKRQAAKASTSKAKKSKASPGETSTKRVQPDITKLKDEPNDRDAKSNEDIDKFKKELSGGKQKEQLTKHLINVREIFMWSNATPIRTVHSDMGYYCCYCEDVYEVPADLKKHTIDNHVGIDNSSFTKRRDFNSFYVKVDITGLRCKLCTDPLDNIEDLVQHLKNDHKKRLFTELKNQLVPFKFEGELLKCFYCSNIYNKFKLLLEHMNTHLRNFVCKYCDVGFITRRRLLTHLDQHRQGPFKCDICLDEFTTMTKVKFHVKTAHKPAKFRNRCRLCNDTFKDYHAKLKHLREVHQVSGTHKCNACDRSFSSRKYYRVHMQRDHLMERRHKCTQCDKSFYQSHCLKDHMLKHTGIRNFQCDVCLKRYGRKSTLRDHMRIHADDRRFKCGHCGQAFVQKCSWRGHMRAKHGEDC